MSTLSDSKTDKRNAVVTGLFFITATVSAIIGALLYDPIINSDDFLIQGVRHVNQIKIGVICELILAVADVGTAIMLYPYLKKFNESMGLGYVTFRLLEVVLILLGIASVIILLQLSISYNYSLETNKNYYYEFGKVLISLRHWMDILGPNFMLGINTFLYSTIFLKSKLIPHKIALIGIIGSVLVFIVSILEIFEIVKSSDALAILFILPVACYEMIIAVWFIVKGFNLK